MNVKNIITYFVFVINLSVFGQKSTEYDYGTPLPPETYQFKKRLVNNVSLYTGQPSIDIPIYSIDLDGMEIPISISYNTGGIKVEEDATSVGLGWNLNIGGQITRTSKGLPDERYFMNRPYNDYFGVGSLKNVLTPNNNGYNVSCSTTLYSNRVNFYQNAFLAGSNPCTNYPSADSRPDDFYYSFFGHSGKFMFSQQLSKFITFPLDDINIGYELGVSQNINFIDNFNVKLPNGFSLLLGKDGRSAISENLGFPFDQSWQIKKITSTKGKEVVYNYISANYNIFTNLSQTVTHVPGSSVYNQLGSNYQSNNTNNREKLISEIIFPNGKILFIYADRVDLQTGSKKLQEIRVLDQANNIVKKIEFIQSYFEANVNLFSGVYADVINKRLKLDGVKFYDSNSSAIENYDFDYFLFDRIPSKISKAQDHWGYFNGKASNVSLFPKNLMSCFNEVSSNGFNRDVDTLYTKTFSLKSIKFPEGGKKYYNYENHKVSPGTMTYDYFKNILNDEFEIKEYSLNISGYNLNYFYPLPNSTNTFNKTFLSESFEVTNLDTSMRPGELNILIKSNLPFQVPNYSNINAEYNKVEFQIEKQQSNGTFLVFSYAGTISKNENANGEINLKTVFPIGVYRLKTIITQNYSFANPNDYNHSHFSNFKIKYRHKVRDELTIGGLRIKDIKTYKSDDLNDIKYTTKFFYLNDNNITSGRSVNAPCYAENVSESYMSTIQDQGIIKSNRVKFSSSSILPLYKTAGSNVGYSKVTQIDYDFSNDKQIKEESFFSFYEPLFSELPEFDDLREYEPRDWQRGKLIKKSYYNENTILKEDFYKYYGDSPEQNMGFVEEINYELMDSNELCPFTTGLSKHMYPSNVFYENFFALGNTYFSYSGNKYSFEACDILVGGPYVQFGPNGAILPTQPVTIKIPYFKIYTGFDKLKSKTTKNYFQGNNVLEQKEEYFYNTLPNNIELSSVKSSTSTDGEFIETRYFYPQNTEMVSEPFVNELITKNIIDSPLLIQSYRGNQKLSEKKIQFANDLTTNGLLLPKYVFEKKGEDSPNNTLERKVTYDAYDLKGNIVQYTKENNMSVVLLWGYNKIYPIAKIENAKMSDVSSALGISDLNNVNETNLTAINNLRQSLPSAMVTTCTYIPLYGISSITDAKGDTNSFVYDNFGRLKYIKDKDGNILSENDYHYKTQN